MVPGADRKPLELITAVPVVLALGHWQFRLVKHIITRLVELRRRLLRAVTSVAVLAAMRAQTKDLAEA